MSVYMYKYMLLQGSVYEQHRNWEWYEDTLIPKHEDPAATPHINIPVPGSELYH